mmetsp:Transcript_31722/g.35138  ORF Transcript_31722/g.35138 Transcript_31722/m.35138 type:complete len:84 (+) Transcript_31722:411-662(+)
MKASISKADDESTEVVTATAAAQNGSVILRNAALRDNEAPAFCWPSEYESARSFITNISNNPLSSILQKLIFLVENYFLRFFN